MKKCLSSLLSLILLFESAAPALAQALPPASAAWTKTALAQTEAFSFYLDAAAQSARPLTPAEELQEICDRVPACSPTPSAALYVALPLDEETFVSVAAQTVALSDKEGLKDLYTFLHDQEAKQYRADVQRVAALFSTLPHEGAQARRILTRVLPSLLLMGHRDAQADAAARGIYHTYFARLNAQYPALADFYEQGKLRRVFSGSETLAPAVQDLAEPLAAAYVGYGLVGMKGSGHKAQTDFALKATATPLAVSAVPAYASMLLSLGEYRLLENYIKSASAYENKPTKGSRTADFLESSMALFSVSSYVSQNKAVSSKYAGGQISRYGFYVQKQGGEEDTVYGNVWEDLPALLVQHGGAEGVKILNRVVFDGLRIVQDSDLTPRAFWNNGALIPFIVGAIGTRKLDKRPAAGNGALQKYFGADQAGLLELSLLSYRFYDLNNASYRRVRGVLAGPYWKAVQGTISPDEAQTLHFSVHSSNGRSASGYNGMVYNPQNRSGLLLRQADQARLAARAKYGSLIKYAGWADAGIAVFFLAQTARAVYGLATAASRYVRVVSAVRARGVKAGWIKTFAAVYKRPAVLAQVHVRLEEAARLRGLQKLQARTAFKAAKNPSDPVLSARAAHAQKNVELYHLTNRLAFDARQVRRGGSSLSRALQKAESGAPLNASEEKLLATFNKYRRTKAEVFETSKDPVAVQRVQARKAQARARAQQQAQAQRAYDESLRQHAHAKAQKKEAYRQSEAYQAKSQAARDAAYKWDAFSSALDRYTLGLATPALKVLRQKTLALNLSLLLQLSDPATVAAAGGRSLLRLGKQIENVQTLSGASAGTLRTFKYGSLRTPQAPRPVLAVAEPKRMTALSGGMWGAKGKVRPAQSAAQEVFTLHKTASAAPAQPAYAFFSKAKADFNAGGYLYSGLPLSLLTNAAARFPFKKSLAQGVMARNALRINPAALRRAVQNHVGEADAQQQTLTQALQAVDAANAAAAARFTAQQAQARSFLSNTLNKLSLLAHHFVTDGAYRRQLADAALAEINALNAPRAFKDELLSSLALPYQNVRTADAPAGFQRAVLPLYRGRGKQIGQVPLQLPAGINTQGLTLRLRGNTLSLLREGGYAYDTQAFVSAADEAALLQRDVTLDLFGKHFTFSRGALQRYALYLTAFVMGLETATPVISDLGRVFGLNVADNTLVMVATYLPYSLGALAANNIKKLLGRKTAMNLGLALVGGSLLYGATMLGLNGHFTAQANTMMHFYKILGAVFFASMGGILLQTSVGPMVTLLSQGESDLRVTQRNALTQQWRAVGMAASYLFPFLAVKLGADWSLCFGMPLPLIAATAFLFNKMKIKTPSVLQAAPEEKAAVQEPAQTVAAPQKRWEKIKNSVQNNDYVRVFKEDMSAKYLIAAVLLLNTIEVTLTAGFQFTIPTLLTDQSWKYPLGLLQFALPFIAGKFLAGKFLEWFPKHGMATATALAAAGAAASLAFATTDPLAFTLCLAFSELGTSTAFGLAFAKTGETPVLQDRLISMIIFTALGCAVGPSVLSPLGNVTGLLAVPAVLTGVAAAIIYVMERAKAVQRARQEEMQKLSHFFLNDNVNAAPQPQAVPVLTEEAEEELLTPQERKVRRLKRMLEELQNDN